MMKDTTPHPRHCLVSFYFQVNSLVCFGLRKYIFFRAGRLRWWCAVPRRRGSGQPFSRCSSQAQNCLEIPVLSKIALLLSYYGIPGEVLGKLGPSLIWRQIEPHIFWCRGKLGPGKLSPGKLDPWCGILGPANRARADWAQPEKVPFFLEELWCSFNFLHLDLTSRSIFLWITVGLSIIGFSLHAPTYFRGPIYWGPVCRTNIFKGPNVPQKNHKGPDLTHQGPILPAQGSNLPGPHLPQKITRGLICWGPICREPPEEGCSKFIKILQSWKENGTQNSFSRFE